MQQFKSLRRLLIFHAVSLLVMLTLYYVILFLDAKHHSEERSVEIFNDLKHELLEHANPNIDEILEQPVFANLSYQLVFMMPSGQTQIYRYTRPDERAFSAVSFPSIDSFTSNSESDSAYTLTSTDLSGTIELRGGYKIYIVIRHQPLVIDWISYRYWLPLMSAIILFMIALLYTLNRQINWQQLLLYAESLNHEAKDTYKRPPFVYKASTPEFLRLGHALSRISYQLHSNHRRINTLEHRLLRLVERSPLPMLMIMRHGQISFVNQRFEQLFASQPKADTSYQLTDFVVGIDESTQRLLNKLSSLRVTRTLIVRSLENNDTYQLHITPWFGEHEQVHGFTVLLNNISEFVQQNQELQQHNEQLQAKLDSQVEVERTDTSVTFQSVDIYTLGQNVSELAQETARQHGLDLLYFFDPDCPRYIYTDSYHLQQLLLTLLTGAITSTQSGYVALSAEVVDLSVLSDAALKTRLRQNHSATWLCFKVQGIDSSVEAEQAVCDRIMLLGGLVERSTTDPAINLYLPAYQPDYQPVYHLNSDLTLIHLIAIVSYDMDAQHLKRLCQHLSITASIYTAIDHAAVQEMLTQLSQSTQVPVLLLDYEYYKANIEAAIQTRSTDTSSSLLEDNTRTYEPVDKPYKPALAALLQDTVLAKILYSMKSERRLSSSLLDQFDSFLTKPLDKTLLLSELLRVSLPARALLMQLSTAHNDNSSARTKTTPDEPVAPLILVVEDSPTNQIITCRILSKLGYRTLLADNGQQALDTLQANQESIDLILMDCRMPVMDGLQATKEIRTQGNNIPIVALTANNTAEDRAACITIGMDDFLSKPIDKNKLQAVLQKFIRS